MNRKFRSFIKQHTYTEAKKLSPQTIRTILLLAQGSISSIKTLTFFSCCSLADKDMLLQALLRSSSSFVTTGKKR